MKIIELKNKKIAILGFGKEGKSNLEFLTRLGIEDITILDRNEQINIEPGINYILGENHLDNLGDFDIIIKSPGISPYHSKILPYKDKLTSGAKLFFDNYEGRVIGVTGTKGKSTTSTLIYKALKQYGYDVKIVGNIGNPILDEIDIISGTKYDYIVYELSSYMLEGFTPKCFISVLINIYPDHLDWHTSIEIYRKAKLNILTESITSLVNSNVTDIDNIEGIKKFGDTGYYYYKGHSFYIGSHKVLDNKKILLKGDHNKSNITAVLGVLDTIGIKDFERFENILETFSGLPHRLENIGVFNEITFIDDSISTTPESTIEAIKTFGEKISTIFLGGTDRGYDFNELIKYLKKFGIKNIVLFPDSGKKILSLLNKEGINRYSIISTLSMKEAVAFAFDYTEKGKICLLSTASPSYSLWKNFEEKGNSYKKEITNY